MILVGIVEGVSGRLNRYMSRLGFLLLGHRCIHGSAWYNFYQMDGSFHPKIAWVDPYLYLGCTKSYDTPLLNFSV